MRVEVRRLKIAEKLRNLKIRMMIKDIVMMDKVMTQIMIKLMKQKEIVRILLKRSRLWTRDLRNLEIFIKLIITLLIFQDRDIRKLNSSISRRMISKN